MKESIYTIPVADGFNEGGQCPFCNMYKKLDEDSVDYTLGSSYMEDDIRLKTDKAGFCKTHYDKMLKKQNALGLALILHSHVKKLNADFKTAVSSALDNLPAKKGLFSKAPDLQTSSISDYLYMLNDSCFICNRINETFLRYFDTFFMMLKKNDEMYGKIKESKGFCLNHFAMLLDFGKKRLSPEEYVKFSQVICAVQLENMKELENDLEWFIQKFDYKNANEPWGNSKDAALRTVLTLSGR